MAVVHDRFDNLLIFKAIVMFLPFDSLLWPHGFDFKVITYEINDVLLSSLIRVCNNSLIQCLKRIPGSIFLWEICLTSKGSKRVCYDSFLRQFARKEKCDLHW